MLLLRYSDDDDDGGGGGGPESWKIAYRTAGWIGLSHHVKTHWSSSTRLLYVEPG